ncbi:CLUMA_CG008105, isoform A [Clunio marinus]|uniref:CLUMA_CG008105, isoform A n=1 Tax=Clunio marinus TaxID=568069 RepID=A0A1J1I2U6_9DIPT|nr:CLUMA_CG008105, isoform A [Clunio marinus]
MKISSPEMKAYKNALIKKSEQLITHEFSKRIGNIDDLLVKRQLLHQNINQKTGNDVDEHFKSNSHVLDTFELIKPAIQDLMNDANLLKMWINFLFPPNEKGLNLSVHKDVLEEIMSIEADAYAMNDRFKNYFRTRAIAVKKVAAFPDVDDFKHHLKELDGKECIAIWHILNQTKNHYYVMHDIIEKNIKMLKKPHRSSFVKRWFS